MPTLRRLLVVASLALLALGSISVSPTRNTSAQTDRSVWASVDLSDAIPNEVILNDIFMLDESNAWLVGGHNQQGLAFKLEWHDGRWAVAHSYEFDAPLYSVFAFSDDNVWVVGTRNDNKANIFTHIVAHKDAKGWTQGRYDDLPRLRSKSLYTFTTIYMLDGGNEGWIGGTEWGTDCKFTCAWGVLLHYKDGEWQRLMPTSFTAGIHGIDVAPGGGYAVGSDGILRYNLSDWQRETLPPAPPWTSSRACGTLYYACTTLLDVYTSNGEEAWAVGGRNFTDATEDALLLHRTNGRWQQVIPGGSIAGTQPTIGSRPYFYSVSFGRDNVGFVVGRAGTYYEALGPYILSISQGDELHYEQAPYIPGASLTSVSNIDAEHALAVGSITNLQGRVTGNLILSYVYGDSPPQSAPSPTASGPSPTARPGPPSETPTPTPLPGSPPTTREQNKEYGDGIYFEVVGHNLRGGFRVYWAQNGGLAQFGYPLTEEFTEISPTDGKLYTVQYFERARMEWHPENRPPFDVLLGLLGNYVAEVHRGHAPFHPAQPSLSPSSLNFPETQHSVPSQFAAYWQVRGLPVYGYPISEAFYEVSKADGKTYLVQYFERNRLEYHPDLPEPFRVSLGLLGAELLTARGWLR